jgi:hypothetical protein
MEIDMIPDWKILDSTIKEVKDRLPADVKRFVSRKVVFILSDDYGTSKIFSSKDVDFKVKKSAPYVVFIHSKHLRSRWAVAHEIAHGFLKNIGKPNSEQDANNQALHWGFSCDLRPKKYSFCPRCNNLLIELNGVLQCTVCGYPRDLDILLVENQLNYERNMQLGTAWMLLFMMSGR